MLCSVLLRGAPWALCPLADNFARISRDTAALRGAAFEALTEEPINVYASQALGPSCDEVGRDVVKISRMWATCGIVVMGKFLLQA